MYFTGLQNVSHFKYYPKSNFRKKSFCETKSHFLKNHMDKQLSNKTELIRFLVYITTWQISCPSPLPQKTLCGNQARDKDSSLMRLRGRERPEISLANNSIHGHLCVTALLEVQDTLCREGQMLFRVGVVLSNQLKVQEVVSCHLSIPLPMAAAWQQLYQSPVQIKSQR